MADQLPDFQELAAVPAISGIAMIAEEVAALVAREAADMGGGSYQFHPDELRAVLKQWQGLQNTISAAMTTVHTHVPSSSTVLAPGNETASDKVASAARTTNVAYQDYLKSMQSYVEGYVNKLSGALNNYLVTESDNAGLSASAQHHLA
jgi:hypothetical protein